MKDCISDSSSWVQEMGFYFIDPISYLSVFRPISLHFWFLHVWALCWPVVFHASVAIGRLWMGGRMPVVRVWGEALWVSVWWRWSPGCWLDRIHIELFTTEVAEEKQKAQGPGDRWSEVKPKRFDTITLRVLLSDAPSPPYVQSRAIMWVLCHCGDKMPSLLQRRCKFNHLQKSL